MAELEYVKPCQLLRVTGRDHTVKRALANSGLEREKTALWKKNYVK